MHKTLARIIRKHQGTPLDEALYANLLESLSTYFYQYDEDRSLLERSLMLTSDELNAINSKLIGQLNDNLSKKLELELSLVKHQALFDVNPEAIIVLSEDGCVSQLNTAACKLLTSKSEDILGLDSKGFIKKWLSLICDPDTFYKKLKALQYDKTKKIFGSVEMKNGKFFEYHSLPEMLNGKYFGRVWCLQDITTFKNNEKDLKHQVFHDQLTNLPNRAYLQRKINSLVSEELDNDNYFAVLFIDFDNFKNVNDIAGHEEGDKFLLKASSILKSCLRKEDVLGRLGGDEFLAILLESKSDTSVSTVCNRILSAFLLPFIIKNRQYYISCSIGVSRFPHDAQEWRELTKMADIAMYKAKNNGKNSFTFFDKTMEKDILLRIDVENQLREAIEKKQFVLHFQPKTSLLTEKIIGAEALIRWQHPDNILWYPDRFINIAENTGLIHLITYWVVESACEKLVQWKNTALDGVSISVNVSAIDIGRPEFLDDMNTILNKYDCEKGLLEIEITESAFTNDIHYMSNIIAELKKKDIRLSIDDFGTGYSSFSYLQYLDVDYLKIDRSFIQDVHKNKKSSAIVKSIIDLGKNLEIGIIAEGVECREECEFLLENNCLIVQGYYYSRPIEEKELYNYQVKILNS